MYWPNSKDKPVNTDRNLQISLIQLQHFADFEIRDFEIKSVRYIYTYIVCTLFSYSKAIDEG